MPDEDQARFWEFVQNLQDDPLPNLRIMWDTTVESGMLRFLVPFLIINTVGRILRRRMLAKKDREDAAQRAQAGASSVKSETKKGK